MERVADTSGPSAHSQEMMERSKRSGQRVMEGIWDASLSLMGKNADDPARREEATNEDEAAP